MTNNHAPQHTGNTFQESLEAVVKAESAVRRQTSCRTLIPLEMTGQIAEICGSPVTVSCSDCNEGLCQDCSVTCCGEVFCKACVEDHRCGQ